MPLVIGIARPALADDSHYQDFIVGARAVGLGGAFASLADDSSGIYYNPAGIADVHATSYQASTSLYGFERSSYNRQDLTLPVAGLEELKVQFTELIVIPASAGFVKTFGRRGADGLPQQAYALSVVVPSFRSFTSTSGGGSEEMSNGTLTTLPPDYSRRVTDRSIWTGLGYGRKFGRYLRLGVSGTYVLRSAIDTEEVAVSARVEDGDDDAANDQYLFRTARNDIAFLNGNVLFNVGAKLELDDRWRLGVSVQLPSLRIHSQSQLRFSLGESSPACETLAIAEETCAAEPLLQDPRSLYLARTIDGKSETPQAPHIRAGVSYQRTLRYTLSLDTTYHFPVTYSLITSADLDDDLRARLPFNPEVQREGVLNVNLGAEFLVIREVSVAAGLYSDFSSAPKIPKEPSADQQPRVDISGLTIAFGYFGEHSFSRVGLLYSWGNGHDVLPTNDIDRVLSAEQTFKRVEYFQSFFYVFLSSTFRY